MNDAHDNADTDREMLQRHVPSPQDVLREQAKKNATFTRMRSRPNPIHADPEVQYVDVRLYFPKDGYDEKQILDAVNRLLQLEDDELCRSVMCGLVSAYQLKNTGYVQVLPDDKPLA